MKVADRAIIALGAMIVFGGAARAEPARERGVCYSAAETREKIAALKLIEPFRVMRITAARLQADAIAAKLCRRNKEMVYVISLLRRDGRVIHVFINAANGQNVAAH